MDHALQVAAISETICWHLKLNIDLANAIALGHDLGHAPFGHTGEEALNELCREEGLGDFMHEANSLRVVDTMRELHGETLNLTYEVRDGIVCHCGETYERVLKPQREKDVTQVGAGAARVQRPYTLEGCVVRYVDRVAYLAADLQDALELKIIRKRDIPRKIIVDLGTGSGEIIGRLTEDIISVSSGNDYISTSKTTFDSIEELYRFSIERIYNCDAIARQKQQAKYKLRDLFSEYLQLFHKYYGGGNRSLRTRYREKAHRVFFEFLDTTEYDEKPIAGRIVIDFIAGMTDNFALETFDNIFPIRMG